MKGLLIVWFMLGLGIAGAIFFISSDYPTIGIARGLVPGAFWGLPAATPLWSIAAGIAVFILLAGMVYFYFNRK